VRLISAVNELIFCAFESHRLQAGRQKSVQNFSVLQRHIKSSGFLFLVACLKFKLRVALEIEELKIKILMHYSEAKNCCLSQKPVFHQKVREKSMDSLFEPRAIINDEFHGFSFIQVLDSGGVR
jgi:hypothetical protein